MRRPIAIAVALLVLAHLLPSCARPPACVHAAARSLCEDGTACAQHDDCASGACIDGTCVASCRTEPCPSTRICLTAGPSQPITCSATCPDRFAYVGPHEGRICASGVVVACADLRAPEVVCDACGCPDGEHCFAPLDAACDDTSCHCGPPAPLHASCVRPSDCASGNCDPDLGCQPPAGTACTPGDGTCALCDPADTAYSCRQECTEAPDCDGAFCIERNGRHAACYADCGASVSSCAVRERCTTPDAEGHQYCVPS